MTFIVIMWPYLKKFFLSFFLWNDLNLCAPFLIVRITKFSNESHKVKLYFTRFLMRITLNVFYVFRSMRLVATKYTFTSVLISKRQRKRDRHAKTMPIEIDFSIWILEIVCSGNSWEYGSLTNKIAIKRNEQS